MSKNITFRIKDKDNINLEEVDQLAEDLDLSRTNLIVKALEIITDLDPRLIKYIDKIADNVNLTFAEVVQGFIINRLAEIDARQEVWDSPTVLNELQQTNKGAPDSEYLYKTLKARYKEKMTKEKIQDLLEKEKAEEKHNVDLLSEDEKQFLIEHKAGRTYYNSEQYKKDNEQAATRRKKEEEIRQKNREIEKKHGIDPEDPEPLDDDSTGWE